MKRDVHCPQCSCHGIQQTNLLDVVMPALTGHTVHPHQSVTSIKQPGSAHTRIYLHAYYYCVIVSCFYSKKDDAKVLPQLQRKTQKRLLCALFIPAVFAHSEGSNSRPLLHRPHLQDPPAGGVDNHEQSMASGKGGEGGVFTVASLFLNLEPAQLSISVTCSFINRTESLLSCLT